MVNENEAPKCFWQNSKKYLLEALVKVRGRCEKKLHVYLLQNPKELSWQYNAGWTVQFE